MRKILSYCSGLSVCIQLKSTSRTAGDRNVTVLFCRRAEVRRARMQEFATERDWNQYHTPRNLLLALVGEVGELSEIL